MNTRAAVARWLRTYREAWRKNAPERLGPLFSSGAIYRSAPFRRPHRGPTRAIEYTRRTLSAGHSPDIHFGRPIISGARAAVEWWTAEVERGKVVTLAGCVFLRFKENGECDRVRDYWHTAPGRHHPPKDWGT
jgi:SnoaL-like protein